MDSTTSIERFLEFCELVDSADASESWSVRWLSALRDGQSLTLRLLVDTHLDDPPSQAWEIRCPDSREIFLRECSFENPVLSHDHVLLWDYQEPVIQLNFTGPPHSHEEVLSALYERHYAIAGHWLPFDR